MSRPVHQPVLLLDGEPLLVIDADDELADETKVGKIITSEAMAAGPQVQKPEDRNVIICSICSTISLPTCLLWSASESGLSCLWPSSGDWLG